MWKTLSPILNRNKNSKPKSINKLNINGKNIYNDKDIADALNNYFANIGKNLSHQINNNNSRSFRNYLKNPVSESIFIKPTNYKEVEKEFDQFKTTKATMDIFNVKTLKFVQTEIIPALVIVFNKSMKTGVFPDFLKVAKVIPIYKDDEADLPKNYRPISLLTIFDKLLEKVVYTRVKSFLDKHRVLYKYQFGFRSKSSTTYALLDVLDYIYTSLDQGKYVFGVYIDLKKAFDTVSHKILLTKLEHYGIRGLALNWFSSYLSNRSQFVFINNVSSSIISTCNYGVPQGSVLGPLLFLLFINDIHEAIKCSTIKLFADDTNCFFSGYDFETLRETVVTEVCSLQQWINANKLTINYDPKKSRFSVFKPLNRELPDTYKDDLFIHDNILKYKEHTNYLGLILDDKLTWKEHNDELNKKLVKYTGIFAKLQHILPMKCRKILYDAFIFSRLNYGVELYANNNTQGQLNTLMITQNKILKILQFKKRNAKTNELYKEFEVLKLQDLHMFNICCLVHKVINNREILPQAINTLFTQNSQVHDYDTRQKEELHPNNINTRSFGAKTISYQGRIFWNQLPQNIKDEKSLNVFKRKLKAHLLSTY